MRVKDIMISEVICLKENMTFEEAFKILREHRISGAPVLSELGCLCGVLSEKDLFKVIHPTYEKFMENPEIYSNFDRQEAEVEAARGRLVKDLMNKNILSVDMETPVMKAGAVMLAKGVHRLPVVEEGELVGLITRKGVYRNLLTRALEA